MSQKWDKIEKDINIIIGSAESERENAKRLLEAHEKAMQVERENAEADCARRVLKARENAEADYSKILHNLKDEMDDLRSADMHEVAYLMRWGKHLTEENAELRDELRQAMVEKENEVTRDTVKSFDQLRDSFLDNVKRMTGSMGGPENRKKWIAKLKELKRLLNPEEKGKYESDIQEQITRLETENLRGRQTIKFYT